MKSIREKLTDKVIRHYQTDLSIRQIKDTESSLVFRYHEERQKGSFFVTKTIKGKVTWRKLDSYPDISTTIARKMMTIALEQLALHSLNGIAAQTNGKAMHKVNDVLDWYRLRIIQDRQLSPHTVKGIVSAIESHLMPKLGHVAIDELDKVLLDKQLMFPGQKQLQLSSLRHVYQVLKRSFKLAHNVGVLLENPIVSFQFNDFVSARVKPKQSRLSVIQLPKVFEAMSHSTAQLRALIGLMLLYGTRIGETLCTKWHDFDQRSGFWRIQADNTKTGQAHKLPITTTATELLDQYKQTLVGSRRSSFVFAQVRNKRLAMTAQYGSQLVSKSAKGQWSAHDLRKLARTIWGELGIDYVIGEFLLNHRLRQVDQAYIQSFADTKCREAVESWHHYLMTNGLAQVLSPRQS